jgi:hypothetical protein
MKPGDLVRLNDSMVLYYKSLNREDLAMSAKSLTFLVLEAMHICEDDPNCKLVSCLTQNGNESFTAMFHSADLIVLQPDVEKTLLINF